MKKYVSRKYSLGFMCMYALSLHTIQAAMTPSAFSNRKGSPTSIQELTFIEPLNQFEVAKMTQDEVNKRLLNAEKKAQLLLNYLAYKHGGDYKRLLAKSDLLHQNIELLKQRHDHFVYFSH